MSLTRRQWFALCAAALVAACTRDKAGRTLPRGSVVLALGDSLTAGYGATPDTAYPAVLAALTGWQVVNAGVSGDTSADARARLPALLTQKPQLVLLSIGGNDFLRRVPTEETRTHIRSILTRLGDEGIPTVLMAQPSLTAAALLTGRLGDHPLYAELAHEYRVPLLARAWSQVLSDTALKSDQIHANAAGYRVFAEKLAAFLHEQGFV